MIDGENPFIILARITVKEGLVNDYLAIAEEADKTATMNIMIIAIICISFFILTVSAVLSDKA